MAALAGARVLVTGATGFVGSHLTRRLVHFSRTQPVEDGRFAQTCNAAYRRGNLEMVVL